MPSSKLAFFRYLLIDRMLRSKQKPYPTMQELLEACEERFGVKSVSTLEKDFAAMRLDFGAPIKYNKRHRGYYYEEPDFQLFSVNLSDEQLMALEFVEGFLEEFKYIPIFSDFSGAVDKVIDGLELTRSFNKEHRSMNRFMQIDKSPYAKGKEALSDLVKAVTAQEAIFLTYRKFGAAEAKEYEVHPYFLKEFKSLWYLIGYTMPQQEIRTFAIDRIEGFFRDTKPFIPAESVGFDADAFFLNCYGVTVMGQPAEDIVLSFSPFQGNYLKAQPLHPSMKVLQDDDDAFRISLHLVNNYELRSWILSFGASVRVEAPDALREQLQAELDAAAQRYR
jgi:predicted DNA-binding transcriptional regulator YafY